MIRRDSAERMIDVRFPNGFLKPPGPPIPVARPCLPILRHRDAVSLPTATKACQKDTFNLSLTL